MPADSKCDVAISCKNLVNFCRVTSEIMELIIIIIIIIIVFNRAKSQRSTNKFANVRYETAKKPAYFVEYLKTYWTDYRNIFTI